MTLCTGTQGHFFVEPGNTSDPIPTELVERGAFEIDTQHRMVVLYVGLTEAVHRLLGVVRWLDGGTDNVLATHSAQDI
jgi:hypothetical protein